MLLKYRVYKIKRKVGTKLMKFKHKLRRGTNKVVAVILSLVTAVSLLPIHTETALADPSIIGVEAYGNGSAGGSSSSADGQLSKLQGNNIGFRMYLVDKGKNLVGEVHDFFYNGTSGVEGNHIRVGNREIDNIESHNKNDGIRPNFIIDKNPDRAGRTSLARIKDEIVDVPYFCNLSKPNTWLAIRGSAVTEGEEEYRSLFGNEKDFSDAAICNMVNGNLWIMSFIEKFWSKKDIKDIYSYIDTGESLYCFIEPIYQLHIENYEVSESTGTISTYTLLAGYYDYEDDDGAFQNETTPAYLNITTDYTFSGNTVFAGTGYENTNNAFLYVQGNNPTLDAMVDTLLGDKKNQVNFYTDFNDASRHTGISTEKLCVPNVYAPNREVVQRFNGCAIRGTLYDIATSLSDRIATDNTYGNIGINGDETVLYDNIISFVKYAIFGEAANAAYITVPEGGSLCGVAEPTNTTDKPHSLSDIIKYGYGCLAVDLSKLKRYAEEETYEGLYTSTWNENKKVPDRPIGLTRIDNDTNTVTEDGKYPKDIEEVEAASSTNENTEIHRYKIYDKPQINIHKLYEVYDYNTGKFVQEPVLAGVNIIGAPPNIRIEDEDLDEGLYKVVAYCGGKPKDGESIPSNLSHWNKNTNIAWEYLTANLNKTTEGGGATGKSNSKSGYVDFGDATEVCVRLVRYEGSPDGGGDDDTPDPDKQNKN